jgi:hypothetical protein
MPELVQAQSDQKSGQDERKDQIARMVGPIEHPHRAEEEGGDQHQE